MEFVREAAKCATTSAHAGERLFIARQRRKTHTRVIPPSKYERERVRGIEPPCPAWEAGVLPLNYTRVSAHDFRCWRRYCQESTSSEP